MLIVTLGLMLTVILLWNLGYWGRLHAAELGTMSQRWLASYQASQPASSM